MSAAAALIRPHWLDGIHAVSGKPKQGLAHWFASQDYQCYTPLANGPSGQVEEFSLTIAHRTTFLDAVAYDCSRMATAAYESCYAIRQVPALPRSTAWLLVKQYYGAFFAAHALLRMIGTMQTRIEANHAASITSVINAWGMSNGLATTGGDYTCAFDPATSVLHCARDAAGGGSHLTMWRAFLARIIQLRNDVLAGGGLDRVQFATQLHALSDNLSLEGANGSWLSRVRNQVNYQQDGGTWFPYLGSNSKSSSKLLLALSSRIQDPMRIPLTARTADRLIRFVLTCQFITNLCRVVVLDMSERDPNGKSFHKQGCVRLMNVVQAPESAA